MLIMVHGDVGSGKTLFSTGFAMQDTRPLYANYRIHRKGWHDLKPSMLVTLDKPSLVIMDEAYTWLESRTSSSHLNRYLSYILFQSRKRQMDIILTAQLQRTVDVRFRLMANYEVYCESTDIGFLYEITKISSRAVYRPMRMFLSFNEAESIYPKYETYEKIPINTDLVFNISDDKTDVLVEVDEIVDKMLLIAPAKKWNRGIVTDYCLRNNIRRPLVELIFNAIKARSIIDSPTNIKMTE